MGDNSERDKDEKPLSANFAALIEIIRVEGRAYRREEQREDRGKKIREWITIGLLACTLSAVGWQVREMIKVYDPISKQAEASKEAADAATKQSENSDRALVQAQRAWVGPQNAAFVAEPAVGKPIETSIAYQNSGHEPALAFTYFIESFAIGTDQTSDQKATAEIQKYMQACKERKDWVGGSVILSNKLRLWRWLYFDE